LNWDWFFDLIGNRYLITGISAWIIAQVLKLMIHTVVNRKMDFERLFGDGGMPSGHSASVTSVATMCALGCGLDSVQFAISAILAVIVIHDATGVRRETGKQAVLLNKITEFINDLSSGKIDSDVKLKEFVGHTHAQVVAGVLLGFTVAMLSHFLVFGPVA
jgi:acid phosphatase family membrane protein YuiD